jgi:hypothetical protein
MGLKVMRAYFSQGKTVAPGVRGVVRFPRLSRRLRVVSGARCAPRQRRAAPEQANASDPLKRGSYQPRVCGRMIGGVGLLRIPSL